METEIHTATITHRHGINLYHAKSEKGLTSQIFSYVTTWWKELFEEEMPQIEDDAIAQYFEKAEEVGVQEYLEIFSPENLNEIPD